MRNFLIICGICFLCRCCFAQAHVSMCENSQNDTSFCYVLPKDYIVDVQQESFHTMFGNLLYVVTITLSPEGAEKTVALTSDSVTCLLLDSIPIKIDIFSVYENAFPEEPHIYGYDNDGRFLLKKGNSFSVGFQESFLSRHPDFLDQLKCLSNSTR